MKTTVLSFLVMVSLLTPPWAISSEGNNMEKNQALS